MKIAKVFPLYKAGHEHHFGKYRPVSLSKILEKLFIGRLDHFNERHTLLAGSQYGFRTNKSTSLALIELTEEIEACIGNKTDAIGVFIFF